MEQNQNNINSLSSQIKNDLAEGSFLVKWPSWIRWLLFLPAALIVPIVFYLIQSFFTNWYLDIGPNAFYLVILRGVIYGAGFVYVGSLVAPNHQKVVAIILLILLSMIYGASIFYSVITKAQFTDIVESVLTLISGGYITYSIFHND